ncbi:hypothetical protein N0V83_001029 [Neocucurbitaria cava]|uniref:Uncharacterized protein n=1 Tax=Neocucurbitaria cava TaxID=798079 RepID=A0A9W8YKJ1_9PLEO|nr:hypothetical protein N0V83_001029 [Neocucurbitaria cava]
MSTKRCTDHPCAPSGNLESPKSNCVVASQVITPGLGDCPTSSGPDCGWGTPGIGGDGSGQPGEPGGGDGGGGSGGGGGGGGDSGGSGDVYVDPGIWKSQSPHVTCSAPCDFILPPKVLPSPTTITLPPYTTDLEIVWTISGKTTRSFQTTTITLPPITTQTISFWDQTFPPGPAFTFSPIPKINPPPTTITNDKNPEVTRTITPVPYPTIDPEEDSDDDRRNGGPYPHITIDIGPPGPICSGGCGSPCIGCGPGTNAPCIPLINCPRGGGFQDPSDPDKDNDDDDDDDDDDGPEPICPFGPQEGLPAVNPHDLGPDDQVDIHYDGYPGPSDDDQNNPPGGGGGGQPSPTPTPTPTQTPATQRFWVFYMNYITEIDDAYEWQFFSIPFTTTSWSVCDTENAVECSEANTCREAPDGNLTQPPWPNGKYTATRGPADNCVYISDGKGPGTLSCPNKSTVTCKAAENPEEIDCPAVIFANNFYAVAMCDW